MILLRELAERNVVDSAAVGLSRTGNDYLNIPTVLGGLCGCLLIPTGLYFVRSDCAP